MRSNDSNSVGSMKEPKIIKMDWRSLGYWLVWKNGKKVWVPEDDESFNKNTEN